MPFSAAPADVVVDSAGVITGLAGEGPVTAVLHLAKSRESTSALRFASRSLLIGESIAWDIFFLISRVPKIL